LDFIKSIDFPVVIPFDARRIIDLVMLLLTKTQNPRISGGFGQSLFRRDLILALAGCIPAELYIRINPSILFFN